MRGWWPGATEPPRDIPALRRWAVTETLKAVAWGVVFGTVISGVIFALAAIL